MTQDLLEVIVDGVAVLTLNRPDRLNAMSGSMLDGLLEALPRLAEDAAVGAIVLTGAGRGFCAGGDVKAMAEGTEMSGTTLEERARGLRTHMEVSRWLHEMPKPTIAMVKGAAAGAGLSLALACDLRMAGESARFATAFARVGYSGDFGGSYFLTQLVGTGKARELYYTAEIVDAPQALALGLVNRVVPDARLEQETMALAARIAKGPRVALSYMKRNMNAAESGTLKDLLDLEAWHHARTGMTEDHREAARAFVEKREPQFKGKQSTGRLGSDAPGEVEDARTHSDEHRRRGHRGELGQPRQRGAREPGERQTDHGDDGRAAAHHRAASGGEPEDARSGTEHAALGSPAGLCHPVAPMEPEREVGPDDQRHQGEAREVAHGDGEAPVDPVGTVRGEPEQREPPGPLEALGERALAGDEVLGEALEPGVEREDVEGLSRQRQHERRHEDIQPEDRGRDQHEGLHPGTEGRRESSEHASRCAQRCL